MPLRSLVYGIIGLLMTTAGLLWPRVGLRRHPRDATHLGLTQVAFARFISWWTSGRPGACLPALTVMAPQMVVVDLIVLQALVVADGPTRLVLLIGFGLLGFLLLVAMRRRRMRGLGRAAFMFLALVITGLSVHDALVHGRNLAILYLLLISWLGMATVAGWQLARELRRAVRELAASNLQLRTVVDERTQALLRTDADLASRVSELNLLHKIARVTTTVQELGPALSEVLVATCTVLRAQSGLLRLHPSGGDPAVTVPWFAVEPDAELRAQRIAELSRIAVGDRSGAAPAALIATPLVQGDGTAGVLVLAREGEAPFSEHEHRLASSVAADVSELVVRHRLVAELRSSATAQERQRIARELHDSVTQTLYSVSMIAEALPQTYERDPGAGRLATQQIRELMLTALAELRALLLELRSASLEKAGLARLVHEQAAAFTARYRIPVDVVVTNEPSVGMEEKLAVHRAVRELLFNVARHADATRVALHLRTLPGGGGRLDVVDDGRGFEPSEVDRNHHGLAIVRERSAAMGGTLAVTSARGEGTHVVLEWP